MKWLVILIISVCTVLASSNPDFGWREEAVKKSYPVLKAINNERMRFKVLNVSERYYPDYDSLFTVNYDYELNQVLYEYERDLTEPMGNTTLGHVLMDQPEWRYYRLYGYKYLFRHKTTNNLPKILKKSRNCYRLNLCNKTEFHNYETCMKDKKECENMHLFFPRILKETFSRVSHIESDGYVYYFGRMGWKFSDGTDWPFSTR